MRVELLKVDFEKGLYCDVIVSPLRVRDKNVTPYDRQELAAGQMEDDGDFGWGMDHYKVDCMRSFEGLL